MAFIITSDDILNKVAAPNLPLAPFEYDRQYVDQLTNVLRLYFNRLDALTSQLKATGAPCVVADLLDASEAGVGAYGFVTDADTPVFGSAVTGGGAVAVPVYSDGTQWLVG